MSDLPPPLPPRANSAPSSPTGPKKKMKIDLISSTSLNISRDMVRIATQLVAEGKIGMPDKDLERVGWGQYRAIYHGLTADKKRTIRAMIQKRKDELMAKEREPRLEAKQWTRTVSPEDYGRVFAHASIDRWITHVARLTTLDEYEEMEQRMTLMARYTCYSHIIQLYYFAECF